MQSLAAPSDTRKAGQQEATYDAIVIGAGVCGLYKLHKLLDAGFRVLVVEGADGVGGTWNANRYPGCRFDSESYSYGYSFSPDLLREWNWSERFAAQPETLRYLQAVAERFQLIRHIQFGHRVTAATWNEGSRTWTVRLDDNRTLTTCFLLTAMGHLSVPTYPRYPGQDTFPGPSFHTYDWPREGIDLTGKRVAVIGTGASGVQVISAIARDVAELVVFQRNPNWCAPLRNGPISPAEMEQIRGCYDEIFARCHETPGGFIHGPDPRKTFHVPREERRAFWEKLYAEPGFGIWLGNFKDTFTDPAANAELTAFIAGKIGERINDPATADALIPKDHGFGAKRVPMETCYYEVYNQSNVRLVQLNRTPITRVTPDGIETTEASFKFDVIVYATGFDAVTGAFDRIDFQGVGRTRLRDRWTGGPRSFAGAATVGFPNLITLIGPQSGSVSTNFPRGIEEFCDWSTAFLVFLRDHGYSRFEVTEEAENSWVNHVQEMASRMILSTGKSWLTGYNENLDRAKLERFPTYTGGAVRYRRTLCEQADNGYPAFRFQ
jgi:cation diffusion facilitator CzcD-associated flavoprotein CzcO